MRGDVAGPVTPVRHEGDFAPRRTASLTWLGASWGQPGRYPWLVSYLSSRGLATRVRWMLVVATAAAYGVLPVTMLCSPSGAHRPLSRVMVVVVAGVLVLAAGPLGLGVATTVAGDRSRRDRRRGHRRHLYELRRPNDRARRVHDLRDPRRSYRLLPFPTHAGRNVVLGLVVATLLGWRTLHVTGAVVTLNVYVVVTVAILGISMNTHLIVHVLGVDLTVADTDPLGGL